MGIYCPAAEALCANPFHVSKYPTIKLVRYGEVARKEYRGKVHIEGRVTPLNFVALYGHTRSVIIQEEKAHH